MKDVNVSETREVEENSKMVISSSNNQPAGMFDIAIYIGLLFRCFIFLIYIYNSFSFDLSDKEERLRQLILYRAAMDGDWKSAEKIYKDYQKDITATLSKQEDTALHIAVTAKRSTFVKELLKNQPEGTMGLLDMKNKAGDTPFCLAAACGNVKLAKLMMKTVQELQQIDPREGNLAMIPGRQHMLPLEMAALFSHKEMVKYLYPITLIESLDEHSRLNLFINMIINGLYGTNHPCF